MAPVGRAFAANLLLTNPGSAAGKSRLRAVSEPLLTIGEVAARLRVSRATAYRLVQAQAIPCIRVSNAIRVRRADLDAFIERTQHPKP